MSNEAKMTLEEKVVQKIKSDTLMAIVGDEDAILELAKRAVHEALYQPQRIRDGYQVREIDSIAVAAAREIAKAAIEKAVEKLAADMLADPAIVEAAGKAIVTLLPDVLLRAAQDFTAGISRNQALVVTNNLAEMIRSGAFRSLT